MGDGVSGRGLVDDVGAWLTIADLAPAYLFLASPGAGQVNGARLQV